MWLDGICKKCGSVVLETTINDFDESDEDTSTCDYKNQCTNPACSEHKWHYIGDMEELDYYIHYPSIAKDERFKNILQEILKEKNI